MKPLGSKTQKIYSQCRALWARGNAKCHHLSNACTLLPTFIYILLIGSTCWELKALGFQVPINDATESSISPAENNTT